MANQFVENKDRWLKLSEYSDFEYALLFIKVWIPFNAWYCNNYPQHKNADSKILKEVKTDGNLFRTRIISLLKGGDSESKNFRSILGQLHEALEKHYIPNHDDRITFDQLHFRDNPNKVSKSTKRRIDYQAELIVNANGEAMGAKMVMIKSNISKLNYSHSKYSPTHLFSDSDFNKLQPHQKQMAEKIFFAVDPKRKESLISSVKPYIEAGSFKFIGDADVLSKAIIQVLYRLRCILFHGEIQPSKDNLSVYEHAYMLLRMAIKALQ